MANMFWLFGRRTSLESFNIFNVLGVQYREIRHSNYLGWLLDPNESLNLKDIFLKGLFEKLQKLNFFKSIYNDAQQAALTLIQKMGWHYL